MCKTTKAMTILTVGAVTATGAGIVRRRQSMFPTMLLAMKIWTNMAVGTPCRSTAQFGFLAPRLPVGHLIVTATGSGFRLGAGLGWMTHLGASPRSTTVDGLRLAVCGVWCHLSRVQRLYLLLMCAPYQL